jgi:hypothetical protein
MIIKHTCVHKLSSISNLPLCLLAASLKVPWWFICVFKGVHELLPHLVRNVHRLIVWTLSFASNSIHVIFSNLHSNYFGFVCLQIDRLDMVHLFAVALPWMVMNFQTLHPLCSQTNPLTWVKGLQHQMRRQLLLRPLKMLQRLFLISFLSG